MSRAGRVYELQAWAVIELLAIVRQHGVDVARGRYPALLARTSGHDREMIEERGFDQAMWWLLTNSCDPSTALDALQSLAAAYPSSASAHARLSEALRFAGRSTEALELHPVHEQATRSREQRRRGPSGGRAGSRGRLSPPRHATPS